MKKMIKMRSLQTYFQIYEKTLRHMLGDKFEKIRENLKEINSEEKHKLILALKLSNINQEFQVYKINKDKKYEIPNLKKQINTGMLSSRTFKISIDGNNYEVKTLYRTVRIKNIAQLDKNMLKKMELFIILLWGQKSETGLMIIPVNKLAFLTKKITLNKLEKVKVKPLVIRKYIDIHKPKVKKLKIQVGGEIGGIAGLKYITLEGDDVLSGIENFYRRYRTRAIMFHKIGPTVGVEFDNGLAILPGGIIRIVSIIDFLIFSKFL